jgi:hypothetical protein
MLLFNWRLGWLMDHWLVIVTHIGRRSRKVWHTPLYVQDYDPATQEVRVVAALGARTGTKIFASRRQSRFKSAWNASSLISAFYQSRKSLN